MEGKLEKAGFQQGAQPDGLPRIAMTVDGLERTGKTHLALTAPTPIAYIPLDPGGERVLRKMAGREIYALPRLSVPRIVRATKDELITSAGAVYQKLAEAYNAAVTEPEIKTIVIDTGTEAWEVLRLAHFGRLSQVKPHNYGPVNAEFRELIRRAKDAGKHLILIHKVKPLYLDDRRVAGQYERAGFNGVGYEVEIALETSWNRKTREFEATFKDCGPNPELTLETFSGEMCNIPMLASLIWPETSPADWE